MVELIDWDCDTIRQLDVSYFLQWTSRDAGASLSGVPQVITPMMSFWRVDITVPREFDGTRLKEFEALVSRMRGRYNVANLCVCDPYKYDADVSPRQWPFDDGTWFTDGTGFTDTASGVQPLVLTADVAVGDTQLYLDLTNPVRPGPRLGDMFSSGGFLYRVVARNSSGWVRFEPPARATMAEGNSPNFSAPRFYGRFIDDMQGQRTREFLKWGSSITVSFVEAFDRGFE